MTDRQTELTLFPVPGEGCADRSSDESQGSTLWGCWQPEVPQADVLRCPSAPAAVAKHPCQPPPSSRCPRCPRCPFSHRSWGRRGSCPRLRRPRPSAVRGVPRRHAILMVTNRPNGDGVRPALGWPWAGPSWLSTFLHSQPQNGPKNRDTRTAEPGDFASLHDSTKVAPENQHFWDTIFVLLRKRR